MGVRMKTPFRKESFRVVDGVRILTENQISRLSDPALKRYRRIALAKQQVWHNSVLRFCCEVCREVISRREATDQEKRYIRMYDYLVAAANREKQRRERLNTN